MNRNILVLLCVLSISFTKAQTSIFNELLQKHVSKDGLVDYQSFKNDELKLEKYLTYLEKTKPDASWSTNQQKAFWMNAYNAYTIKLILENYPLNSILDIKKNGANAWKIPFAKVGGENYTLDYIEHEILRKKLFDVRIHVGVNCASISCPKLANIAFTEENINEELNKLMRIFVNDENRNQLDTNNIKLSEIFNWFKDDFSKTSSLIDYLNTYSKTKIETNAKISFLPYNWSLNELKTK